MKDLKNANSVNSGQLTRKRFETDFKTIFVFLEHYSIDLKGSRLLKESP